MTSKDSNNPVDSARELREDLDQVISMAMFGKPTQEIDPGQVSKFIKLTDKLYPVLVPHIQNMFASKLEEIGARVIGAPLKRDTTWIPTSGDPYGINQMSNKNRTTTPREEWDYGSVETVRQQYRRLATEIEKLKKA